MPYTCCVKYSSGITLVYILVVFIITLYPYQVEFHPITAVQFVRPGFLWGKTNPADVIKNGLLFIPLGALLTYFMMSFKKAGRARTVFAVLIASFSISCFIELLQMYIPSRFASFADVLSNTFGALIGILLVVYYEEYLSRIARACIYFIDNKTALAVAAYSVLLIGTSVSFSWLTSLNNWNHNYSLLVGNEKTGDRQWSGRIYELILLDEVISAVDAERYFNDGSLITDHVISLYRFDSYKTYQDEAGNLPSLVWRGDIQDQNYEGALLKPGKWLESEKPPEYLAKTISGKSRFTLAAHFSTNDLVQEGPARMVSYSEDTGNRNFTLGQDGRDLIFRLRTPLTGRNGVIPELRVSDILSDYGPHRVIASYDGSRLILYIDTVRKEYSLNLQPREMIISKMYGTPLAYDLMKYKGIYYAVISMPLGIFLAQITYHMGGSKFIHGMVVLLFIICISILLELILNTVNKGEFTGENVIISSLFMLISLISFEGMKGYVHMRAYGS